MKKITLEMQFRCHGLKKIVKKKNNIGMTLVEVIIALALLTLSIGGILGVIVQSTSAGQSIDNTYVATNIAKSRIERLREVRRDRGYADLVNWQEAGVSIDRNGVATSTGDFERTTIVDSAYGSNLTKVTVRVRYKLGGSFIPVSVELVTLLSPYYS